jgi:hypothetical protein
MQTEGACRCRFEDAGLLVHERRAQDPSKKSLECQAPTRRVPAGRLTLKCGLTSCQPETSCFFLFRAELDGLDTSLD